MHYAGMAEPEASNLFVYRNQEIKKLLILYPKNQNSGKMLYMIVKFTKNHMKKITGTSKNVYEY